MTRWLRFLRINKPIYIAVFGYGIILGYIDQNYYFGIIWKRYSICWCKYKKYGWKCLDYDGYRWHKE